MATPRLQRAPARRGRGSTVRGAENAYAGVAQAFADGLLLFLPGGNPRAAIFRPASTPPRTIAASPAVGRINAAQRIPP